MASRDYEEFIAALNERSARYLIVGAHAVAFHALDVLIDPTPANAQRVSPVRIDLHAGLEGLSDFDAIWCRRVDARFGSVDAHYLSLDDLLKAKEATGREQDRADVVVLRRARDA